MCSTAGAKASRARWMGWFESHRRRRLNSVTLSDPCGTGFESGPRSDRRLSDREGLRRSVVRAFDLSGETPLRYRSRARSFLPGRPAGRGNTGLADRPTRDGALRHPVHADLRSGPLRPVAYLVGRADPGLRIHAPASASPQQAATKARVRSRNATAASQPLPVGCNGSPMTTAARPGRGKKLLPRISSRVP